VGLKQGDLFGGADRATPRGWTELDKLRRRYSTLEKKVLLGDYNDREIEEFHRLSSKIIEREREAREAWSKSFGK
jgi:hypothetical protein